jgi:adenylate cyclase
VTGLLLIAGVVATVRYVTFSSFRNPPVPSVGGQSPIRTEEAQPPLPLPDKPSLVVLPFVNMSEDPKQDYFSDGITEDLTTALSQISSLFVIARNSAFTYKGKAVKVQDVSREMGVRYVLEGSVRKAADQVRVTAQLIDATTGGHLWSQRYDRPFKDIFALQDEIVQKIVTTLKLQLTLREQGFLVRKTTDNLEAYDYYLRGLEHFARRTKEANIQAQQMFEKAIALDPQYAEAHAMLGVVYWWNGANQWSPTPQAWEQAFALGQQAVTLNDSVFAAHVLLGAIYMGKKQYEQATVEAERAISLAPNSSQGYVTLVAVLNVTGQAEKAIEVIKQAQRLDPHSWVLYQMTLGWSYLLTRRHDEAIATQQRVLSRTRDMLDPHLILTICYSELGREEVQVEAAEVLRVSPSFSLDVVKQRWPFKDPADLERLLAALRKAGLK